MSSDIIERMRSSFRAEALELLAELDAALLALETEPENSDFVHRVFRAIHTVKGSGATAMMPLEAESWTAETAHSCDPESLREGVVRAFDAARRVSHPLLFGTIAMGVLAHRAAESQPARGWREPTPRHRASAA